MKIKGVFIFLFLFLFLVSGVYIQDARCKDPFNPLLPPKKIDSLGVPRTEGKVKERAVLPSLKVEGILWGGELPQTIINGEVYEVGDTLKDADAVILKIKKNNVLIFYEKQIYDVEISRNKGAE